MGGNELRGRGLLSPSARRVDHVFSSTGNQVTQSDAFHK